jgi:hypothetical protein
LKQRLELHASTRDVATVENSFLNPLQKSK